MLHLSQKLYGGAQLGKAVKGRSKEGKKDDSGRGLSEEEQRIRRKEMTDQCKRLTVAKKALLQKFMAQEEQMSRMAKLQIQAHWSKIMSLTKVKVLRQEVDRRSQEHERDVTGKEALIHVLLRDLDTADEQFQLALRAHLIHVEDLIELQDARLRSLEMEFRAEFHDLENDWQTERTKLVEQHTKECKDLEHVMHTVHEQATAQEAGARQDHAQSREEIRNKHEEDMNVVRLTLNTTMAELETQLETTHVKYLQTTAQRTQEIQALTATDHNLLQTIDLKIRKSERLQQSLTLWRAKRAHHVREVSERHHALKDEKAAILHQYQQLKATMNCRREKQRRRLVQLAQGSREVTKKLDAHLRLSERILQLGELVRKLETERERVWPVDSSNESIVEELPESVPLALRTENGRPEDAEIQKRDFQPQGLRPGVALTERNYLDFLWARHNKVLLDELTLRCKKERVATENRELQILLQQYLAGISVPATVLDGANPLVVVNGRLRLPHHPASEDGKPHCGPPIIDANHMVDTNRVSHSTAR